MAVVLLGLLCLSCTRMIPWRDEPLGAEVNLAFTLEDNLVVLQSVRVDNRPGHFILGSAAPQTVVDPGFALASGPSHVVQMGDRQTVRITPVTQDLRGVADAIIGGEPWRQHAISIDYRAGLVTYQKAGIHRGEMETFRFPAEPMINVLVDGRIVPAVVDTSSPDTLVLPAAQHARGTAEVTVAGTSFGTIDVQFAEVRQARIGNRLLSRFLVTIDYGRKVVGLWRDPRIPLHELPPVAVEGAS